MLGRGDTELSMYIMFMAVHLNFSKTQMSDNKTLIHSGCKKKNQEKFI